MYESKQKLGNNMRQHIVIHMPNCRITSNSIPTTADNTNQEPGVQVLKLTTGWCYSTALFPYANTIQTAGSTTVIGNNGRKTLSVQGIELGDTPWHANAEPVYDGYSKDLSKSATDSRMRTFATSVVLGQMAALRNSSRSYISNAASGLLARTNIDDKIKKAYDILLKPGFTKAALERQIDSLFEKSTNQYVKSIGLASTTGLTDTTYRKTLI
jgi:hypothetical protein